MDLPEIGSEFEGKYRIVDVLGEGGFAVVFGADDIGAKRRVALKVLKPIEGGYQAATTSRFYREINILGQLRDPHTVTLFDFGSTEDGLLFIVFEFVPGEDLSQVIKGEGVLAPEATVHVLNQVLRSLREAHQRGLLHRDIKPQNIRVSEYMGDPLRVTLLDFGIAKPVKPGPELSAITHAGALVGTPQYMSPEQLLEKELTAASDIYSLGLVAYEMLVGEPAVSGNSLSDQLRILGGQGSLHLPPSAPVPPDLRRVIDRMLSREQSNRMQSAEQVLRSLAACHLPSGDVSLDETGALASVSGVRPITGPQAAPPTTGQQLAPGSGGQRAPSADLVPVQAGGYAAGNGYYGSSDSMVRPVMPYDQSHSSAQIPLQAAQPGSTTVVSEVEEEWPTWMLAVGGLIVVGLLALVVLMLVKALDEPQSPTVRTLPISAPAPTQPQPSQDPKATAEPDTAPIKPSDGCGTMPDLLGEVVVSVQDGPLDPVEKVMVYLPKNYDPDTRHPLIVAFHDYPGGAWGVMRRSQLKTLADRESIVVAAVEDEVEGFDGLWTTESDIARAQKAVGHVTKTFCIDRARIFGYGHGAGGRAVNRLACSFFALTATATTAFRPEPDHARLCGRAQPVPHLNIDPQRAPSQPARGGAACGKFNNPVMSTVDYEEELRLQGRCSKTSTVWKKHEFGECRKWSCKGAERVTCRVEGGREFPGTKPRSGIGVDPLCDGEPVDFPYADVIWQFFEEAAASQAKGAEP